MVLDVKAMTWATQNGLDTAKLKAAKVPIYGKWYFPEIPANLPLVNLDTGERKVFPERMVAGEVMWVSEADLRRAGLVSGTGAPESGTEMPEAATPAAHRATGPVVEAEPMIAMSRAPEGSPAHAASEAIRFRNDGSLRPEADQATIDAIHMPKASMAPLILAIGFTLAVLGVFTHVLILVIGLIWCLVGTIAWVRIGLLEFDEAQHAHH